jgi:hypothetical protein
MRPTGDDFRHWAGCWMRSRAIQLGLIVVFGAGVGFLASRNWGAGEGSGTPSTPAAATQSSAATDAPRTSTLSAKSSAAAPAGDAAPPPPREFKLPVMTPAIPAKPSASAKAADTTQQLGVAVQVASQGGPLPRPANLGFEESVPADATLREIPPDSIAGVRF